MIYIPHRLENKLIKDDVWYSNTKKVVENVKKLYVVTPYFFQEYTNHGVIHINNILDILDKLIPDNSLENLTEKELGICIISLILHDIGMFVTYDGFTQLLKDECAYADLEKKQTFHEKWQEYLLDLKYYSEKQLMGKFGATDIDLAEIEKGGKLCDEGRLVIGEFLRQNHHHIAHYIILNGIEGIDFLDKMTLDDEIRDLIGLIARSHGMDVRDTEIFLKSKFRLISRPKNICIIYLMAIVRIADILDVGEERAPHIIRSFYVKKSEDSKKEFSWNQCIKYEDFVWENEKELLSVDASPKNSRQFTDVKKWVKGVQYELDLCWAIIGEHYDVNLYKMTIRRLDSNILKKEVVAEYEEKFHTQEAHLDANADILKLLIEPLYGSEPSYGVREILQNAIDACREMEKIKKDRGEAYKGKVVINLDTKQKKIEFSDNGAGMNIDIIKKYYLIAGASYRRSEAWNKEFVGAGGEIKISRNGKFGIGVLATFLLGERAEVITRSYKEEKGWKFSIQLDQDNIEIERVDTSPGTKISISLTDEIIDKLQKNPAWDCCAWNEWYEGNSPSVTYIVNGETIDADRHKLEVKYFDLVQDEYGQYSWSYDNSLRFGHKDVCCNGIIIPQKPHFTDDAKYRFSLAVPHLKIEDLRGCLPVDLARSKLLFVPCEEALYTECCKYVLAKFLSLEMKDKGDRDGKKFFWNSKWIQEGEHIVFGKNGYTLLDPAFLELAGIKFVNFLAIESDAKSRGITTISTDFPVIFHELKRRGVTKSLFEDIIAEQRFTPKNMAISLCRLHLDKKIYGSFSQELQKQKWSHFEVKEMEDRFTIYSQNQEEAETINFCINDFPFVAELNIRSKDLHKDEIMYNLLQKYLQPDCCIPYDLDERKRMFPKAFEELKKYM